MKGVAMAKGGKVTARKIVHQHPQGGRTISISQPSRRNKKGYFVPYGTKPQTPRPFFNFQKAFRKIKRIRLPFLS
jgi:hypothetical protein